MHNIHTGQIAALTRQLANGQLLEPESTLGKGQAEGEQRLQGGCGCNADILSIRQELAAASGYPGRDRG